MSPFARARAPELEHRYGLSPADMLAFIDGLNESFMANPVLQATNTLGNIVGFIPLSTAQVVGGSINVASGLGMAATSIIRTKQYMAQANENIFRPKGLHAQICKTEKMLVRTGVRCDGSVFAQGQYQAMIDSAGMENASRNHLARRMEALGGGVVELEFDGLDAPVAPSNWMKKFGAYSAQRAEKSQLKKLDKKQAKADRKTSKAEKKGRKHERRAEKRLNKAAKNVKKMLWIVITTDKESLSGDDDWDSGDESDEFSDAKGHGDR